MPKIAPRFWLPAEEPIELSDVGFLPDPDEPIGASFNPALRRFAELDDVDCLILIGEPGLGKTTALQQERKLALLRTAATDDQVLAVDLGATGDEGILAARIFEADTYRTWLEGRGALHLLLDSLD